MGLAPLDNLNLPSRLTLDLVDWPIDNYSIPIDTKTKFLSAIEAGLLDAISVFLDGIVVPAIRDGNESMIRTTIFAMTFWCVTEGIGSIASRDAYNVVFNSIYLSLVLAPLLWKDTEKEAII